MKGLVLSGGKGTRLRPITHTSAKQLVPVANKPILFYGLEAIAKSDIKEVGIVVGDTKNEIKSAVGDGSKFGLKVTYIEQEAPLGLAHAVKISQSFLKDDEFVMYLGDNLIRDGIKTFVDKKYNVLPHIITGWWKDTGKLEDMLEANRIILDTLESKNLGKVENSSIEGKVILQKNAEIK